MAQHLRRKRNRICTIYRILDPQSRLVVYVGQTVQPLEKRLGQHMKKAYDLSTEHIPWYVYLRKLSRAETKPIIERIVETIEGPDADTTERRWINHYRRTNPNLFNDGRGVNPVPCGTVEEATPNDSNHENL